MVASLKHQTPNLKELGGQGVSAQRAEGVGDTGARTFLWNISGGNLFILVKDATKTARTKRDGNATAFLSLS